MDERFHKSLRLKIGSRFKKIRSQKKLSLRQVEAITGIDHSWVGKFEKGLVNFEIDSLIQLLSSLGIQLSEVFDFDYKVPED